VIGRVREAQLKRGVRSKQLSIIGYSNFATPREVMAREYARLLEHALSGKVEVEIETVPFDRLATHGGVRTRAPGSSSSSLRSSMSSALRRSRAAAQMLSGRRGGTAEEIVARLLAVQAQSLRAARLAIRARGTGLRASDIDRALTEERSLVVAWLGRGTLHLVRSEDDRWLPGLTAPTRLAANRRRLAQEHIAPKAADRAVAVVERALAD
jgi:hypothetical protein